MKKYRIKKKNIFILLFIFVLIVFSVILINVFKEKSYNIVYDLDDFSITEKYMSSEKLYYYAVDYKDIKYDFVLNNDYYKDRKLVKNIDILQDDDYLCLIISSDYFSIYPLCSKGVEVIDYHLVGDNLKEKMSSYFNDIESDIKEDSNYVLYNDNVDYLIWNYKGFNRVKNNEIEAIDIFKKDIYEVPLATRINNYVFIPDYEQKYIFDRAYVINLDNNKVEKWELDYSISFDSFVLGTNNKSIYIVDANKKKEYEIVPHKKKLRIVNSRDGRGVVFNGTKQDKISLNKIISEKIHFSYDNNYQYKIDNNYLYLSYLDYNNIIKVSNKNVDKIIDVKDDGVYYISSDTLFKYDLENGETPILQYSELEFNNDNMIIINN